MTPSDNAIFIRYHRGDIAGLWIRASILFIDLAILFIADLAVFVLLFAVLAAIRPGTLFIAVPFIACLLVPFLYLTLLKRSQLRTVGYRALRYKVVSISGESPTFSQMCKRLVLWFFVHPLVNLLSISHDEFGQAASDEVAGTMVVKTTAQPIGTYPSRPALLSINTGLFITHRPVRETGQMPGPEVHIKGATDLDLTT